MNTQGLTGQTAVPFSLAGGDLLPADAATLPAFRVLLERANTTPGGALSLAERFQYAAARGLIAEAAALSAAPAAAHPAATPAARLRRAHRDVSLTLLAHVLAAAVRSAPPNAPAKGVADTASDPDTAAALTTLLSAAAWAMARGEPADDAEGDPELDTEMLTWAETLGAEPAQAAVRQIVDQAQTTVDHLAEREEDLLITVREGLGDATACLRDGAGALLGPRLSERDALAAQRAARRQASLLPLLTLVALVVGARGAAQAALTRLASPTPQAAGRARTMKMAEIIALWHLPHARAHLVALRRGTAPLAAFASL